MTVADKTRHYISEAALREQVRSLCQVLGWRMAFTQYSIRSPKGMPDLVLCRPPRLIFAELKSEIGRLSPEQEQWIAELRQVPGVDVFVWRPHDIEEIAAVLGAHTTSAHREDREEENRDAK